MSKFSVIVLVKICLRLETGCQQMPIRFPTIHLKKIPLSWPSARPGTSEVVLPLTVARVFLGPCLGFSTGAGDSVVFSFSAMAPHCHLAAAEQRRRVRTPLAAAIARQTRTPLRPRPQGGPAVTASPKHLLPIGACKESAGTLDRSHPAIATDRCRLVACYSFRLFIPRHPHDQHIYLALPFSPMS